MPRSNRHANSGSGVKVRPVGKRAAFMLVALLVIWGLPVITLLALVLAFGVRWPLALVAAFGVFGVAILLVPAVVAHASKGKWFESVEELREAEQTF